MGKKIFFTSVTVLLVAIVIGCDSSGGDSSSVGIPEKEYEIPTVLSLEDLPNSEADTSFTNEEEAQEIFTEALAAINKTAEQNSQVASILSGARNARATESETIPIDEVIVLGNGGTISSKGSVKTYYEYPDDDWSPKANTTYSNFEILQINTELNTEIENCIMENEGESYTMNGESQDNMYISFTDNLYTGEDLVDGTDARYDARIFFSYGYVAAYSIRRNSDGKGGKFIVTFSGSITDEQEDIESLSLSSFYSKLYSQTVIIKVYNDANELVLTTFLPLTELSNDIEYFLEEL